MGRFVPGGPHQNCGRHELKTSEAPGAVRSAIDVEHASLLALPARLVARGERLRAIQISDAARLIGRIAAPIKTRESTQRAAVPCFEPLLRRRREIPRTRALNSDIRHWHSLQAELV